MNHPHVARGRRPLLALLASCLAAASWPCVGRAAEQLPDELTLNVGKVMRQDAVGGTGNATLGDEVTLVLRKRSMRADNYRCFVITDAGPKQVEFPVSTYRGHVKEDPLVHVNANIEPGGILNVNFTEGRAIIARIRGLKIDVPAGTCTPSMSTGNKVVPLASVRPRQVPTPGGYLVPPVPMRRTRWIVSAPRSYTSHSSLEKVVSQVEQRMNDGDIAFARDTGTAWEIETLLLEDPQGTKQADAGAFHADVPERWRMFKHACFTGQEGRNHGKWDSLAASGVHLEAGILLHEAAHLYGNPWHQLGAGDGLCGGGAFWDENNVAFLTESQKQFDSRGSDRDEQNSPAVIYGGPLPPRASHDFANTTKDTPVTIDVLENDYDGNGDALTLAAVQEQSRKGGTVAVSAEGRAVYTPPPGFVGLDTFTYTVVDATGVGNRSGTVKVDVRDGGLALHLDFESVESESIEQRRKTAPNDHLLWLYGLVDKRPEAAQLMFHFRNVGPYDPGTRATTHWIDHRPVPGVRGNGLLNPGGDPKAQLELDSDAGDPGRGSLSASLWVLFPEGATPGTLLCKGGMPWHGGECPVNGWSISRNGTGFKFSGNTVRLLPNEKFSLQSQDPVAPNRWYHLAMVMDRDAGRLRGYVDGREVPADGQNVVIPPGVIEYWARLHVFNAYGGKWWRAADGLVDEVKIFTAALTPEQVAGLHAEGKDAKVPDIKKP